MAILNGGFPGGGGVAEEVYSTEETRIGTWIDGKPLYRRVLIGTTPKSINNWETVGSIGTEKDLISCFTALDPQNGYKVIIPYYDTQLAIAIRFVVSTGDLQLYITRNDAVNHPCTIISEYTKTTDPAPTSALSAAPAATRAPSILPTAAVTAAEAEI